MSRRYPPLVPGYTKLARWFALTLVAGALGLSASASAGAVALPTASSERAAAGGLKTFTFQITIRNLGRSDLTSPVYAIHNRSARLFRLGKKASAGLAALAEDGATSQLLAEARAKRGVGQASIGPRIPPRKSASFRVTTTAKHLRLSWASMLVCSNDTFAGQTAARLPAKKVGARKIVRLRGLDGGSEQNTESERHVPCLGAHGVGPSESKLVRRSPGIQDIADLENATQGWGRFLARVTIKRVA